jgi:hypothetical protein
VLIPAMAATIMRVKPPEDDATARLAAFVPYGLLGYLLALACLLVIVVRARHRLLPTVITVVVMVLTGCHLAWLAPIFVADHRAPATAQFRLMNLNMFNGKRTPAMFGTGRPADVVILVETTPAALTALKPHGWDRAFRTVGDPGRPISNTAVYPASR